ncbi:MAG: efflux transporter outer membrane subunit [Hyphomonadaceae bacterium]|nr:efflux transporter outer membrane subunit [Hyphomonadaceae bacterium]
MSLSQIAYRFRPVFLLITVGLMIIGGFSYFTLPAQEDPHITIREAIVTTRYPGLPAERVELLITRPIEEAMLTVKGIDEIRSTTSDGLSLVYVRAYEEIDPVHIAQMWDEVEEAAVATTGRLPAGTGTPVVNDNFGDVAVITLALTGQDFSMAELFDFAQYVRDRLNTIPGTRSVDIIGNRQERIFVEAENAALADAGISPSVLASSLRAQNIITPGGVVDTGERAFSLLTSGDFQSLEEIENLLIRLPDDGSILRLGDLVTVSRGYADPAPQSAFFNGEEAIVLGVTMREGESVINYSAEAEKAIRQLRQELPVGLNLSVITWQADQVKGAVYGVSRNVLQTLTIVLGVVVLFLGVRTGLIVGSIVPAVVLATLAIMGFSGIALERMSLATIVIALGLLVDNGVVIAEDFKRRLGDHGDRGKALADTGRELAIPLLSSSLTTILVFAPLMISQHSSGEYTRNISIVILITLGASWLLAMTVTPTLCHMFLKTPEKNKGGEAVVESQWSPGLFGVVEKVYDRLLRKILRVRWIFVPAMFLLLPVGGLMIGSTPAKFFPDSDRAQVLIYVNLPAGVTTRTTEARIKEIMAIIGNDERYPGLGDAAAYVGFGGPRFVLSLAPLDPAPNVGFIVVKAADREAVNEAIPRLRDDFRAYLPDVEARVSKMFLGPSDPNVIQVQVKGPDSAYINEKSKELESILASVPGTIDIWSNWFNPVTRLDVRVDQQRALAAGITSTDIAGALSRYVSGGVVSEFRDLDEVYPIVARAVGSERSDLSRLSTIAIFPAGSSTSVPLAQVADINPVHGFSQIQREDLERTVTIEARNVAISPEDMAPLIQDRIDELNAGMRPGHVVEFDGIVVDSAAGREALFANFPICIALAVLLLVAQFNGYRRPIIVVLTIPLVLIGVGVGLQVMGAKFGFLVILGIFALAGIIVNNGIVLIDRIDIERRSGDVDDWEAVVVACVRRLRPILITTITTIVGLLPLIIGRDVLFYGMASILAFGLAIGTLLTLGVAPALYCMLFGIKPPNKRHGKLRSAGALGAAAVTLSACVTAGPDYKVPEEHGGAVYSDYATDTPSLVAEGAEIDPDWWRSFDDPLLDRLIDKALVANTDIRAATARLDEVRARRRAAGAGLLPKVDLEVSAIDTSNSESAQLSTSIPTDFETYTAGFNASWELDIFGRVRRSIELADAEVEASADDRRGVLLLVISETTASYFELRALQQQLEIVEINESIARKSLELTRLLESQNLGSEFDIVRARAELSETSAQKTDLIAAIRSTSAQIAVLAGERPAAMMSDLIETKGALPDPQRIPVGIASDLVKRRPDVRAAERRYASAIANIGVEKTDYFPRFFLTGGYDTSALAVDDLFTSASQAWNYGGIVQWPILDFGRRRAEVDAAEARAESALAMYDGVVLSAFENVESSLAFYVFAVKKIDEFKNAVRDRERALDLAQQRFDGGVDDFFQVLDAQRRLASARNSLADARADALGAQIRVYQSLGGGWMEAERQLVKQAE